MSETTSMFMCHFTRIDRTKLAQRVRPESGRDEITEVKQGTCRQNNRKTSTGLPTKWQCRGKSEGTPVPEYAYRMFSDVYDIITARNEVRARLYFHRHV